MVSLVIDGGRAESALESTVVDVSGGAPVIVREGGVSREELEKTLGRAISLTPGS
jgi:L-threonylcarbamoyladenylate synthase